MQTPIIYRYEFPRPEWDWMHVLGFVYSPQKLAELGNPIYHVQNNPQYYAIGYHPTEDMSGRIVEEKDLFGRKYRAISGYSNPMPIGSEGEGVTASDVIGWLGKIGGVISDIFVPGSSIALEMAMDNLGSAIDDYTAMKKSQAQQHAYYKIISDIKSNPTFTDWQKNNILNIMNQIQVADTAGDSSKVSTLKAKLAKLKAGDYHESAQYKQFKQLIDATGFDTQSKGTLLGWIDAAKNPTNDLTDAQRQAKWDDVARELFKSQQAGITGQRVQLGNAPTAEQIAAHNAALEKQAGITSTTGSGRRKGADKARNIPPLSKDDITPDIIDEYKHSVDTKINTLRADINGLGVKGSQVQSVVFPQDQWTLDQAVKWLYSNGYVAPKVDYKTNTMRFRQIEPEEFNHFAMKTIDSDGKKIDLVIGFHGKKPTGGAARTKLRGSQVHTVVFPQDEWTLKQAVKWLYAHGYKAPKVDYEANTMRFRQIDPKKFKRFATKIVNSDGKKINLVIGFHTTRKPKNINTMISE